MVAIIEKGEGPGVKKKRSLKRKERPDRTAGGPGGVMLPSAVTTLSGASAIDNFDRIMHRVEEKIRDRERMMERASNKRMPHLVTERGRESALQVLREQKEVVYHDRGGTKDNGANLMSQRVSVQNPQIVGKEDKRKVRL